jgi:hypothetical protein
LEQRIAERLSQLRALDDEARAASAMDEARAPHVGRDG